MDVAIVVQRTGTIVVPHEHYHQKDDLEHVENWNSRHLFQLHLAFPHHLVSQHDLAYLNGLAVYLEKTLVHFAREVSPLIHRVHSDVNLIVRETVQNYHEIEQH